MKRDINTIVRDLEDKKNNDIIFKKDRIKKMFEEDPDILEILGQKEKCPLNKFNNETKPTEEELNERQAIIDYNEKVSHQQVVPYLKLNGIQKEVLNFLMFDIDDTDVSYTNEAIKNQMLIVMCLVHEDDMDTEYGIVRTDLLSYLVKDLLCWSNALGLQMKCVADVGDIIDSRYYCRTLKFLTEAPNHTKYGMNNRHDRFTV